MNLSGRVHFEHVAVGDRLWKFFDGNQEPTKIGEVIGLATNSKGKPVVVLDGQSVLGSDRLSRKAFQRLTIRKEM